MSSLGWKLSRPPFFEKFKTTPDVLKKGGRNKPESLGYICDDIYFLWRSSTKTIVRAECSDIWRNDEILEPWHQEWSLSSPIPFNITNLNVRKRLQEMCLLWSSSGIAAVTFPRKRGTSDLVADSVVLGEWVYVENPGLSIIQAKWHPNTGKDIVLVLNNDYFIRCYDLSDPSVSFSVVCAGPASSVPFNFSPASGGQSEPPVDFDIGPHLYDSDQWTIFLLKSSGCISYLLMKVIESTRRCFWEAEKVVAVDGDLHDVLELPTTLLVSPTFPVVITIGSLSGKLYHSVLIPSDTDTHDFLNMEGAIVSGETTLFVKEVLELEPEAQLSYVKLIPDPLCFYRYACVHEGGIHVITMNFVPYMLSLLKEKEELPEVDTASTCRYVLCCQDESKNIVTSSTFSNSVPQKFVTITGSGEVLVYDIPKYPSLKVILARAKTTAQPTEKAASPHGVPELRALETLTPLLSKTINQPYLSCADDLSPEKRETLLRDSLRTLEQEYIQKQEQAVDFLHTTLIYLQEKMDDLTEPLSSLVELQPVVRAKAEEIAERYEEENEVNESLRKRLEAVVIKRQQALPVMTDAEKVWLKKLETLSEEVGQMKEQVDGLKGKVGRVRAPVSGPSMPNKDGKMILSPYELLKIKKEIGENQKELAELAASFHQIEASVAI